MRDIGTIRCKRERDLIMLPSYASTSMRVAALVDFTGEAFSEAHKHSNEIVTIGI